MFALLMIAIVSFVAFGCAQGRWVNPEADSEQTQRDVAACEILSSVQPFPATLGEKRRANPDLSSLDIQKCMQSKGYQWVTGDAQPQDKELLEIAPQPDRSNQ